MSISIPKLPSDADALTAALGYAQAGWYVGPVKQGTKNPGSILGAAWPTHTSREPEVIASWFAGTNYGVFLHVGRSGALVLDVDSPSRVPDWLRAELDTTPFHQTRANVNLPNEQARGHHIFSLNGESYGNGISGFTSRSEAGWGDVRGSNGVIVVFPSQHPAGGQYAWERAGECPEPSGELKQRLRPAADNEVAASDREVQDFLSRYVVKGDVAERESEARIGTIEVSAARKVAEGASRHDTLAEHLAWAMDDARSDLLSAPAATVALKQWFDSEFAPGGTRRAKPNEGEFLGCLSWAVGQARAKPQSAVDARRERVLDVESEVRSVNDWVLDTLMAEITTQRTKQRVKDQRFVDFQHLMKEQDLSEFVVPHFLYEGDQALIYSQAGVGKSLLTLEWACKLALGSAIFDENTTPMTVLYVDQENPRQTLRDRLENMGFSDPNILDKLNTNLKYSLYSELHPLDTKQGGKDLVALAAEVGASIVIVDTTGSLVEGEENSNDTYISFGKYTVNPMRAAGIAGIYLDHAGKDLGRGARGGSAKAKDMDVVYQMTLKSDYQIRMVREKNRSNYEGDADVMLKRADNPLRHDLVAATTEARVQGLLQRAVALGLGPNTGRPTVHKALTEAGESCTQRQAAEVAKRLKLQGPSTVTEVLERS